MFTIRNVGGFALFLLGTTFLWLTPSFATRGLSTKGLWWSTTNALALLTVAGFSVATWGLFSRADWWEWVAIGSAILGFIVLIPYWVAAHGSGETTPWFNVVIHAIGNLGVLLLLRVPSWERWVDGHVMSGR